MDKRSYAELERRLKELEQPIQSEAHSRDFKFATKDLIYFRGSRDWSADFFDRKIEDLTGYHLEDFLDRKIKWLDIVHEDDKAIARDVVKSALKSDKYYKAEYRIVSKQEEVKWIIIRGYIVCDEKGDFLYVQGVLNEITSKKLVEQQLANEKTFSDFLIQQSSAAILIINTDFTIAEINEPYLKAVNKSREEVIGAHCYEISHGYNSPCSSVRPNMQCPMVETLRTGMSAHVIHEHPGPDNKPTFCNLVTYPLKNQDGEILQIIEIWRDITEKLLYRWEKQVDELKSDLQKMVQEDRMISLGKLVDSCAHEINNPIQGVLTFSDLMQEILAVKEPNSEDLEQFKKHLAHMSSELERCGNIVSGLLSFSRQNSGGYNDIDLNEVLYAVINLTRHKMELGGVELITDISPELLMIHGNVRELQQCFINLVFNAIEAMPGGGQLEIISKLSTNEQQACIEIRDTGYGISEENIAHLFDPFFTTKEDGQGAGLGLSIVYGVIKNHKGNIQINSKVGAGSSFILDFPLI